jgi:hypothetical protein
MAVAAAGLAVKASAEPQPGDDPSARSAPTTLDSGAQHHQALAPLALEPSDAVQASLSAAAAPGFAADHGHALAGFHAPAPSLAPALFDAGHASAPAALPGGTDAHAATAAALPPLAPAMPAPGLLLAHAGLADAPQATTEVARVLLDALAGGHGGTLDTALAALPASGGAGIEHVQALPDAWHALAAAAPLHTIFLAEALAAHVDAPAVA